MQESKFIHRLEENLICILLATTTLLVFFEVVLRFVFNHGYMWAEELTLPLSGWMVLLGASYGVRVGSHIGVDALVKIVPPHVRKVMGLLAVALSLVYCGLYIYGAVIYLEKMHMIELEMEDLPMLRWQAHSVLVIGFGLLGLRLVQVGIRILSGRSEGFCLLDEAKESLKEIEKDKCEEVKV